MERIFHTLESMYKKEWEKENGRSINEWWPVSGKFNPKELEIILGAVLTQNTNWNNVEKALRNMENFGLVSAEKIASCNINKIRKAIKPAGFFNQKAVRIKNICRFILSNPDFYESITREELIKIKGIGPETADSIMLYALGKKEFVVDAYTKRIFSRIGLTKYDIKYEELKNFIQNSIKQDVEFYRIAHALIVEHAKKTCRKSPLCHKCSIKGCKRIMEQ